MVHICQYYQQPKNSCWLISTWPSNGGSNRKCTQLLLIWRTTTLRNTMEHVDEVPWSTMPCSEAHIMYIYIYTCIYVYIYICIYIYIRILTYLQHMTNIRHPGHSEITETSCNYLWPRPKCFPVSTQGTGQPRKKQPQASASCSSRARSKLWWKAGRERRMPSSWS